jgi:peptidoglycan/LPS O-acetylase OafA/YrhL
MSRGSVVVDAVEARRDARQPDERSPAAEPTAELASVPQPSGIAYDNRSYSLGLGALRGIAAIGVVIYHVFLFVPIGGIDLPHSMPLDLSHLHLLAQHLFLALFNGRGLVVLFFVLSGCVLSLSLDRRPGFGPADVPGYLVRRGMRLYPLLILAASAGALLQMIIGPNALPAASSWANWHYDVPREALPYEWFKNAIGYSNSLNSPAWSIGVELVASAIFPVLYFLSLRPIRAAVSLVCLVVAMFAIAPLPGNLQIFAFSFFVGALIPRYGRTVARWYEALGPVGRRLLLLAALLPFMFGRRLILTFHPSVAATTLVESLCAGVVVSLILFRPCPRLFATPLLQWLGRVSYGIYLLHIIVLFALAYLVLPYLSTEGTGAAISAILVLGAGTLVIVLPLSWATYGALEDPMQRLGSRWDRQLRRTKLH